MISIRPLISIASACALMLSLSASAALSFDQQVQLLRVAGEADRQALVTANVDFTTAESEQFWPIYRDYRAEVAKTTDRLIAVIKTYAEEYPNVSDEQAKRLIKEHLAIEADRVKLKQKYVKRFGKVLPTVKVARVLQVESKLDAVATVEISAQIPLVPAR